MFLGTYVEARRQAVLSGWFSSSSLFGAKEYAQNNINNLSYAAGGQAMPDYQKKPNLQRTSVAEVNLGMFLGDSER
ncbi:MAG TPA: hypothetical protein VIE65_09865 [Methylobacter sp.]|jgi:hypothetical protein